MQPCKKYRRYVLFSIDEKWKELSIEERQEKEQFLRSEEHVSKSFMEMVGLYVRYTVTQ